MTDYYTANAGSGGDNFAADDISSVKHPRVKVEWGVDNSAVDASVTDPLPVQLISTTNGGLTMHSITCASSANATNVKASAGKLHTIIATNNASSARFLKFYNSASAPTAGSGTPVLRIMLPAGGGISFASPTGLSFSSGIGYTLVTGAGDSNSSAVTADDVYLNLGYV